MSFILLYYTFNSTIRTQFKSHFRFLLLNYSIMLKSNELQKCRSNILSDKVMEKSLFNQPDELDKAKTNFLFIQCPQSTSSLIWIFYFFVNGIHGWSVCTTSHTFHAIHLLNVCFNQFYCLVEESHAKKPC